MSDIPVWGPILAVLFELTSSDEILRVLNLAGFTGFNLNQQDNYSHNTRKRAYNQIASAQFSHLSEDQQWMRAGALCRELNQRGPEIRDRLATVLGGVNWRFDGKQFSKTDEPAHTKPAFFTAGEAHDAYVHIRDILQTAKSELLIIDPWARGRLYQLVATVDNLKKCRILGGPKGQADFIQEAEAFAKQHANPSLEIRSSTEFHDRLVIVDHTKVYMFGASIEHAGDRAFAILPIESQDLARFVIEYAEKVWGAAPQLFPRR